MEGEGVGGFCLVCQVLVVVAVLSVTFVPGTSVSAFRHLCGEFLNPLVWCILPRVNFSLEVRRDESERDSNSHLG